MPVDRAADYAAAGHRGLTAAEAAELRDALASEASPTVHAVALGALVRSGPVDVARAAWSVAAADAAEAVRRQAARLAPALGAVIPEPEVLALLADRDALVAEAGAFALGERAGTPTAVGALVAATMSHRDPLVREAAVAALGAIGDPTGLPAVLHTCEDKPAIRRRAVLALAAFEGPEVEVRLHAALEDRDWQVRQAAEDVLNA